MRETELISQREAAWVLDVHHELSRPRVTRLLATGVVGAPVRAGGALLYDGDAVRRLAARPRRTRADLATGGLRRVIVLRRAVDLLADRATQEAQLTDGWNLNYLDCLGMTWKIEADGPIPVVVTVSGFVILGAELAGFTRSSMAPGKRVRLVVREPGSWFEPLRETRLDVIPGATFSFWDAGQPDAVPPNPIQLPSSSR